MTVNDTQYIFDHSVEDVDLYQNYKILHGVVTLVNMRVMGDRIVVRAKNKHLDVKTVIALWTKWLENNQDLPEIQIREPTGLNLPSNTPTKRIKKAKMEEDERDTVIDTKDDESDEDEEEDEEDENDENEEEEEKGDEVIIE
jgi:cobalamin biosynthesis protein CobT